MSESERVSQLRQEIVRVRNDERYPSALKTWLIEQLEVKIADAERMEAIAQKEKKSGAL